MDFVTQPATPADDSDIRRLLAANPVPGNITLTYRREPNYFLGCGTMGHFYQVGVARHHPTHQLAGFVCRATRPLFVNGRAQEVGYLSQLRVHPQFQGRWLVSQGFQYLRHLHRDGQVPFYLATIIEGNEQAVGVLVNRARRGYPRFQEICRLHTLALFVRRPKSLSSSGYDFSRGSAADLPAIVRFLNQHGAHKQFFPAYTPADFANSPLTLNFSPEDFVVAWQGKTPVGVMGLWDQSGYKQTVVQGYGGWLKRFRPLVSLGLRLLGAKPMPAPGGSLNFAYAAFVCIANNDPAIFDQLLRRVYNLAAARGFAYLMIGLTQTDPLLAAARRYLHVPYHSRVYLVSWQADEDYPARPDGRIPYLEIAAL
jgi:hypothetical protein